MVSVDPGTLNRAAWVNFVAAFFNEEVQGAAVFDKIKRDYDNWPVEGRLTRD